MGYSADLRERVITAVDEGMSRRAAGRHFKVGESTAVKWVEHFETTGSTAPKPRVENNRSPLNDHKEWLLALVEAESDLTLREIVDRLAAQGVAVCESAVWRFFHRNGITYKKNRARQRAG